MNWRETLEPYSRMARNMEHPANQTLPAPCTSSLAPRRASVSRADGPPGKEA